jgi:hypothetical protein
MAFTPPTEFPEDWEELESALGKVYLEGKEAGKKELREAIKEFLTRKFFGAKGRNRRADPEDPNTAAVLAMMETLYEAFRTGTL